ncbi:hypothetical protein [Methylobacterium radiodurans]|uniref:hypothetical protein n=1 Tax=Methylobacterium radiodurans TaxID=2202828 RepID=UPI0013A59F65|nr:hypothetical protein [Methylobacterium radiodurans]
MSKNDLQPPQSGPGRNPVLHGVAHGLAKLFPPVEQPQARGRETERRADARQGRD